MDTKNEGFVPREVFLAGLKELKEQSKCLGFPQRQASPEDIERTKKIYDPEGTGKVTFENFIKLVKSGIERMKAAALYI